MQVVDTEQIYTGAQGIKAKIPAGYTLLEETVQPETDETYAYYGFDTYNDPDRLQSGQGRGYDSGGDHVRR